MLRHGCPPLREQGLGDSLANPNYPVGVGGTSTEDICLLQHDGLLSPCLGRDGGAGATHAGAYGDDVDFDIPRALCGISILRTQGTGPKPLSALYSMAPAPQQVSLWTGPFQDLAVYDYLRAYVYKMIDPRR